MRNQLRRINKKTLIKSSKTTFFFLSNQKDQDTSPLKSSLIELVVMLILKNYRNVSSIKTLMSTISKLKRKSKMQRP